jgi:endonuclease/exonuclease/phosphatase family metal-dependent hydrolase
MSESPPSVRLRRFIRWILIPALMIAAVGFWFGRAQSTGPAEGSGLIGTTDTKPLRNSLRIGTFNIDGGQGLDGQLDLDRTVRCLQRLDFIGLNEVHGDMFDSATNQAKILGGKLDLPYLYVPAEQRFGNPTFGNAIFSDLPVTHWQRIVLPSARFRALRNYTVSDIDWHGTTVHFLTTHVDFKAGGDEQLGIVTQVFLNLPEPAVLMGDLNHTAASPQIQQLLASKGVEEAIDYFLGPPPPPPKGRVDWIFLRGLRAVDAGIVDFGASDHPAYWAEVKLQ